MTVLYCGGGWRWKCKPSVLFYLFQMLICIHIQPCHCIQSSWPVWPDVTIQQWALCHGHTQQMSHLNLHLHDYVSFKQVEQSTAFWCFWAFWDVLKWEARGGAEDMCSTTPPDLTNKKKLFFFMLEQIIKFIKDTNCLNHLLFFFFYWMFHCQLTRHHQRFCHNLIYFQKWMFHCSPVLLCVLWT